MVRKKRKPSKKHKPHTTSKAAKEKRAAEVKEGENRASELSERESVIFELLRRRKAASADDILVELKNHDMTLDAKRSSHSLGVLMKYLTAKACQDGWIITMIGGGRGAGNKATYSVEKRF